MPATPLEPSAFRADPIAVYAFVGRFFEALERAGVANVCISPGSRSTPLAISAERTSGIRTFVGLDERASSFFALGLAKASRRPVAILCTSGTAAANYLPAIVEAHYSRVPLIVLTADRPPELRDWGAGQTIEQPGLFGRYPRWAAEVPLVSEGADGLRYAERLAARAADEAWASPSGPVHLNWPFREPLAPPPIRGGDCSARLRSEASPPTFSHAARTASEPDVEALVALVERYERGVICCGPMDADEERAGALRKFASASGWPILADPASQLRGEKRDPGAPIVAMGDAIVRAPGFAQSMRPDVVVRIGETPVSKAQRLWIEASEPSQIWWLDEGGSWGEPSHRVTHVVRGGSTSLLTRAAEGLAGTSGVERDWCRRFQTAEATARKTLDNFCSDPGNFSGLVVASRVAHSLDSQDILFASNSMSIRLLDLAHDGANGSPRVLCNRGASGIDGVTSSALGAAVSHTGRSLLLTGDLALLHDLSGLLVAKREAIDLVIVVLDDDGGGIFSFLPIAEQGEEVRFERLFGTPHGLDLSRVASLFELGYARSDTAAELDAAIEAAHQAGGPQLVHVPLDKHRNEASFRDALAQIMRRVDAEVAP
jgi:2-succinyl-5-enolpyruvyl-6-hydroxy-3-cyclohexene-1-carboxylate synthase